MKFNLPIEYQIKVKCPKCLAGIEKQIIIENLELENSRERGMGEEIQYSFSVEIGCPHCGRYTEFEGDLWEYPLGVINGIELA